MDTQTEDILLIAALAFGLWWLYDKSKDQHIDPSVLLMPDNSGTINQLNKNYLTPVGHSREKSFAESANYLIEYKLAGVPHII